MHLEVEFRKIWDRVQEPQTDKFRSCGGDAGKVRGFLLASMCFVKFCWTSPMFCHWEQHWFDLSDTLQFRPCLIKIAESFNTSAEVQNKHGAVRKNAFCSMQFTGKFLPFAAKGKGSLVFQSQTHPLSKVKDVGNKTLAKMRVLVLRCQ